MKKSISSLLLLLVVAFSAAAQTEGGGWTLEKNKNGIKVFTRKTLKSSLKDSKASVVVNTSAKRVLDLFIDFDRHRDWMDRIRASRILKKASSDEFYVYYEVTAPWPASDRDVAIRYKVVHLPDGSFRLDAIAQPDFVPLKNNMIRIPEAVSTWEIVPKGNDRTEVIFTNHSDPGGSVPDWMVNMAATDNPYNTLSNLKKKLEQ